MPTDKADGKELEFWLDGKEHPIKSINVNVDYDEKDSTDTATPGDGKDYEVVRAMRGFSLETNHYSADGAEITSGSLEAGKRYRLTGGEIVETQGTFDIVGQFFESDGSGEASAINKVVPLGNRLSGKNMDLTFDGSTVPVTDIEYAEKFDEQDGTDSATTGDGKEFEASRADREATITLIMRASAADLLTANPVKKAAILTFATGATLQGYLLPISKNPVGDTNQYVKVTYRFKWIGKPTETNMGFIAGVSKPIKIIYKRGASSNKEYLGNATIFTKTVKANIEELNSISYTFTINGALTENVYS